jgi:hypothetical protein
MQFDILSLQQRARARPPVRACSLVSCHCSRKFLPPRCSKYNKPTGRIILPPPRCMHTRAATWELPGSSAAVAGSQTAYYLSHQYRNKSKNQLTSPMPAKLPAVAVLSGHIVYAHAAALLQRQFHNLHISALQSLALTGYQTACTRFASSRG